MPVYSYKCECGNEFRRLIAKGESFPCVECGKECFQSIPTTGSALVYEMPDRNRGKQVKKGIGKQLHKRMSDHHDKYEIAEKIDRHGMDTAKRLGWTKKAKKT